MESSGSFQRILTALFLLSVTLVVGTGGFMMLENYRLIDAIYMTVITMSTVGFGTLHELTDGGKMFAVFLIIISASTFVYAVTTITTFVIEGEVRHLFNRYQVNKRVANLKDHIIICGLGRNGREAVIELLRQEKPCVVVEYNEEVIEDFLSHYPQALVVRGDATLEETLEKASIHAAQGLISSLSTDAENVYITLTARGMNPALHIVARASLESSISKLRRAGANKVIVPNLIGGRKMANILTRPALVEFVDLVSGEGNPDLHLEDIPCANHPQLVGKTLAELHIRSHTGVLVVGYQRKDGHVQLNPQAGAKIDAHDRLFVMGTTPQLRKFRELYLE